MTNNNTTKYKVEQNCKAIKELDGKVDAIMENHLPHLNTELAKVLGKIEKQSSEIRLGIGINVFLFISAIIGIILLIR